MCIFVHPASELVCVPQALLQERKCAHTHTFRNGTKRRNTITSIPETRLISSAFHPNQKLLRICHQCGCLCQTKQFFFLCFLPAASCNSSHMRSTFSTVLYCSWSRQHKAQAYWHLPASVSCSTTRQQQWVQVCTYSLQGSSTLLVPGRLCKNFHQSKSPF